jgi:hypothetical protein
VPAIAADVDLFGTPAIDRAQANRVAVVIAPLPVGGRTVPMRFEFVDPHTPDPNQLTGTDLAQLRCIDVL